jgi:hypothetical protein
LLALRVAREEIGRLEPTGCPSPSDLHLADEIQAKMRQVRKVIPCQGLPMKMSMNQAKAKETGGPRTVALKRGDLDLMIVPHKDHDHRPSPIHQESDLSMDLPGQLGQLAGQIRGDDLGGRNPPPIETLKPTNVPPSYSLYVAVDP